MGAKSSHITFNISAQVLSKCPRTHILNNKISREEGDFKRGGEEMKVDGGVFSKGWGEECSKKKAKKGFHWSDLMLFQRRSGESKFVVCS